MKRSFNLDANEPEQKKFDLPSEKEHLFTVTDIFTNQDEMGQKLRLDDDSVSVKLEVVGGDEAGRTMLHRMNLNEQSKGFFATRLFLKATGQDYKGKIDIDTDLWCGLSFYATVIHNGQYANIDKFNFDKKVEQIAPARRTAAGIVDAVVNPEDIKWNE
jgi:hypothetical protein